MDWIIRSLSRTDDRNNFDCSEPALNDYLQKLAYQHAQRNISKTYVAVPIRSTDQILGFYTLSTGDINFHTFPLTLQKKLPKYPIPVVRIGRLAVDAHGQGKGVGASLLKDALQRCLILSEEIGIFAVVVETKHEKAKSFYLKYGFQEFNDEQLKLFLPIKTIMEVLV